MRNFIIFTLFVLSAYVMLTAGQEKDCSPSWCSYEDLRAASASVKDDFVSLSKINGEIETAIGNARAMGSRAVYALELLLANNHMRLDAPAEAAIHYQKAYDAAPEDKRTNIGVALWNAKKTAADTVLRRCTAPETRGACVAQEYAEAHHIYLWLKNNRGYIPVEWYDRVSKEIEVNLGRTSRHK